tara:strand:- start:1881 stop:2678 length:798 start_codon:yes stop_codon:yes gene_type:complete
MNSEELEKEDSDPIEEGESFEREREFLEKDSDNEGFEEEVEEEVEFDLEAQIDEFRHQIDEEPDNCLHHYNLGEALQELRQFEEAREEFELALTLDDKKEFSAIIHFGLGNLYHSQLMSGTSAEVVLSSVGHVSEHKGKTTITDVNDDDFRRPIEEFQKAIEDLPLLKADEDLVDYIGENAPLQIATAYYKWASDLIDKTRQILHYGDEIEDVKRAMRFLKKVMEIDPNNSAASLLNNLAKKMLAEGWSVYDEYGFIAKEISGNG